MKVSEALNTSKTLLEVIRRNAAIHEIHDLADTCTSAISDIDKALHLALAQEAIVEADRLIRSLKSNSFGRETYWQIYDAEKARAEALRHLDELEKEK